MRTWGHNEHVYSVAWSCDGIVAIGSFDGTVWLLDAATGHVGFELNTHGMCCCVAFSPDGSILASGGGTKCSLWNVE